MSHADDHKRNRRRYQSKYIVFYSVTDELDGLTLSEKLTDWIYERMDKAFEENLKLLVEDAPLILEYIEGEFVVSMLLLQEEGGPEMTPRSRVPLDDLIQTSIDVLSEEKSPQDVAELKALLACLETVTAKARDAVAAVETA